MYAEICSKLQQKTNQRLGIGHMVWYKRVSAGWDHHDHMEKNLIIRLAYNWASERVSESEWPTQCHQNSDWAQICWFRPHALPAHGPFTIAAAGLGTTHGNRFRPWYLVVFILLESRIHHMLLKWPRKAWQNCPQMWYWRGASLQT